LLVKNIKSQIKSHKREMHCHCLWKKLDDNYIVVAYKSLKKNEFFSKQSKIAKANYNAFFQFRKLPDMSGFPQTEVTYSFRFTISG